MTWAAIAVGVGSAVVGAVGSKAASDAQSRAGRNANQANRAALNMAYTAYEPNRYLGYQAGADLASLYGWGTSGYTPLNQLLSGNTNGMYGAGPSGGGGGPFSNLTTIKGALNGSLGGGDPLIGNAVAGFLGGGDNTPYSATINTNTGTVDVKGGHNNLDAQMTAYLQGTGPAPTGGHGRYSKIKQQIDQILAQGYKFTPGQNGAAGSGSFPGQIAPTQPGQPGNMSRFFTSPDYQFRLNEGIAANDRSAAARGGALSGNAIRGNTAYASNLAAGEYNNYVNRLMAIMGIGTNATNNAVQANQNYTNNAMQNAWAQGDARASGVAGYTGAGVGLLNTFGNLLGNRSSTFSGLSPQQTNSALFDINKNYGGSYLSNLIGGP